MNLHQYVQLFRGRGDSYGSWEGGCIRERLTEQTFANHLNEGPNIGVYPHFNHGDRTLCVWGCTDIDYTDDPTRALHLRDTFRAIGIPAWVEKSANGFHIWVFSRDLVDAQDMRNLFLAAHQVAKEPPKEVNPKQGTLTEGMVGNYVRLPYPSYYRDGLTVRYMIDNDGAKIPLEDFVRAAHESRIDGETVRKYAAYYIPPPAPTFEALEPTADMAEAARHLTALGRVIFRDGPLEGNDRSTTMQHLAHECRKAHLNPGDALLLLKDCDLRWGRAKYSSRADGGEKEFLGLIQRAYGHGANT